MTQRESVQFSGAASTDPSKDGIDGLPRCIAVYSVLEESAIPLECPQLLESPLLVSCRGCGPCSLLMTFERIAW